MSARFRTLAARGHRRCVDQPALAQQPTLNLYSARHYQTDEALYDNFTKATGIKINRVDADDAGILARLKTEGSASPADVILLVDAARLWRAEVDGLFQPVQSKLLEDTHSGAAARQRRRPGLAVVRLLDPRPCRRLQQGQRQARRRRYLRGTGGSEEQGHACAPAPGSHPYNLSLVRRDV